MRLKLIACKALCRELSWLSALSENNIDITYVRQGYHNAPEVLRRNLQQEIDLVESGKDPHTNDLGGNGGGVSPLNKADFDAILIGYGLCSNGIVGLRSKTHPLVIPRGHDCITFFLGSKERYADCFRKYPGCYWYTASWIENADMPCRAQEERLREYYLEKGYDEEDLEFFMEEMNGWTKNYKHAAYIKMPFFDKEDYRRFTREAADFYHWDCHEVPGDLSLLERFLAGDWDPEQFLVVPPGYEVIASNDAGVISCRPVSE